MRYKGFGLTRMGQLRPQFLRLGFKSALLIHTKGLRCHEENQILQGMNGGVGVGLYINTKTRSPTV